jgi:hypothetical protein
MPEKAAFGFFFINCHYQNLTKPNKMKTLVLTISALFMSAAMHAQDCFEAKSQAAYAYSHAKQAYDANNRDHLSQFAARAVEAFDNAKIAAQNCGCTTAYNIAYDGSNLIAKAVDIEKWEDGRYYVKKARELGKQLIDELDLCTANIEAANPDLSELQKEQEALKQQQAELMRKQDVIRQKLAMQQQQETHLIKQKLMAKNDSALKAYRASFAKVLASCDCNVSAVATNEIVDISLMSIEELKMHYKNKAISLSEQFAEILKTCN